MAPESMGHVQRQVHRQNPAYNCLRAGHQLRPQLGRERTVRFMSGNRAMHTLSRRKLNEVIANKSDNQVIATILPYLAVTRSLPR